MVKLSHNADNDVEINLLAPTVMYETVDLTDILVCCSVHEQLCK